MHIFYHTEGVTDLSVMRADANYRLDGKYYPPEESIIHMHSQTGKDGEYLLCSDTCLAYRIGPDGSKIVGTVSWVKGMQDMKCGGKIDGEVRTPSV
jgi:hypothetical protein